MTPEQLSDLHASCFIDAPRPWSATEFRDLLASPGVSLLTRPKGFAVLRVAGPEAEVLTLAVAPEARRQGVGRSLVADMVQYARKAGVEDLLLEVSETNTAARNLYENMGFSSAGYRKDYYKPRSGQRVSALVMRKALGHAT